MALKKTRTVVPAKGLINPIPKPLPEGVRESGHAALLREQTKGLPKPKRSTTFAKDGTGASKVSGGASVNGGTV